MSAKRILLIGPGGAGKSTLARRLGEQTGLPVVHLDKLYWTGEWQHLDKDAFDRALEAELAKPEWILDGNFTRTLPCRLEACDLVLYLDYPTRVCLWGILRRILRDVKERQRSLDSVINQYLTTVKPMHEQFVQPSRQYADIVVPEGGHNLVALDMIVPRIRSHIRQA